MKKSHFQKKNKNPRNHYFFKLNQMKWGKNSVFFNIFNKKNYDFLKYTNGKGRQLDGGRKLKFFNIFETKNE